MISQRSCRRICLGTLCCCLIFVLPSAVAQAQTLWASTSKSAGQRPIEVARFGKGNQFVLIVGSLLGNEPESLELLDAACKLASTVPPPEPVTLLFVRTPNPDGLAEHVHTNARGVELNRNFPSPHFTSIPNRLTGPAPASEVETQYMLRVLEEYHPARVVHVRSGWGEHPLIMVNDAWVQNGHAPVLPAHVQQGRFDQTYKAGSLEEYVARQLHGSVATVTLAMRGAKQLQAAELLRFATSNVTPPASPSDLASGSAPPSSAGNSAAPQATVKEVEFLPTPPEYITTSPAGRSNDGEDSRYFELAPPPR